MEVPKLPNGCNSWIIAEVESGKAVMETWSIKVANQFAAKPAYMVYTALSWLQRLNREIKDGRA